MPLNETWPHEKIQSTALDYIRKHAMEPASWRHTILGSVQPDLLRRIELEPGELPIVSFSNSEASWYVLSSRRVLGQFTEDHLDNDVLDVSIDHFGNFKGYGGTDFEVMTLLTSGGSRFSLQYETGRPSMAPIYYFRYWQIKFPVLEKLRG